MTRRKMIKLIKTIITVNLLFYLLIWGIHENLSVENDNPLRYQRSLHKISNRIPLIQSSFSSVQFSEHDPISIHGNEDFHIQAAEEGWDMENTRNGTVSKPYIIDGYEITNSSNHLIEIKNTTLFFYISNNLLNGKNGSFDAIFLNNVTHGVITNNTIYHCTNGIYLYNYAADNIISKNNVFNNSEDGIHLYKSVHTNNLNSNTISNNCGDGIQLFINSSKNIIFNNTVSKNSHNGIWLSFSNSNTIYNNNISNNFKNGLAISSFAYNNTIFDNIVSNNNRHGIAALSNANNNTIFDNIVSSNSRNGVGLYDSFFNIISDNFIFNNSYNGVGLYYLSYKNVLMNNIVFNNTFHGISLTYSAHTNIISDNTISNNFYHGIYLQNSSSNTLSRNSVFKNYYQGIFLLNSSNNKINNNTFLDNNIRSLFLSSSSENNVVKWNDFIGNIPDGNSHAFDGGTNNSFFYNFWWEWTNPDSNSDGIVDDPYPIEGNADNSDPFPLVSFINPNTIEFIPTSIVPSRTSVSGWTIPIFLLSTIATIITKRKNAHQAPSSSKNGRCI